MRYCGAQKGNETQPGILRFHGAYPSDRRWYQAPLIDIVHPQQEWQVRHNTNHSAFLQISLHQPTLVFGISSGIQLDDDEWATIWSIWERAIGKGIGSRVSAGYGQTINHPETQLISVELFVYFGSLSYLFFVIVSVLYRDLFVYLTHLHLFEYLNL